ncbi:MAG: PEGA domain-containing protein [Paludibacter sp.]|nr:PEGA domain-containing protein [Paludibacter sp.]
MKRNILCRLFLLPVLCFALSVQAQNISVESFIRLDNDLDARVHASKRDQNGEVCAIIKVVTTETGFTFDGGTLGIVDAPRKTGEYWLYIPRGAQRITIAHDKLGVLRNYFYPVPIEAATVYEMRLISGKLITSIEKPDTPSQWLIINSEPSEAVVFINDKPVGKTPYQNELPTGNYTYRVSRELYFPEAGVIELINSKERAILNFKLKPNYGTLQISSLPESNAKVSLDGIYTGKITPCTIENVPAGEHILSLTRDEYATVSNVFSIKPEQTLALQLNMDAMFGEVEVRTFPESDIYINGDKKAFGSWKGRLTPGIYSFEGKKDKHYQALEKRTIGAQQKADISLNLSPITGSLKIKTEPFDAVIKLNGDVKGSTPMTIRDLMIGDYKLELAKDGFASIKKPITIKENAETFIDESMSNYRKISISSNPPGAAINLNGQSEGSTPLYITLPFGKNKIQLEKSGYLKFTDNFIVNENQDIYH